MPTRLTCPDARALSDYLLGQMPDEEARGLEEHVAVCSACALKLNEMVDRDTLARPLPSPAVPALETGGEVEALIGRLRDVPALATTVDEPITERPGTVIGPYKLLEQIGEGGFGLVFMAEQQQPIRRKVALKILKPGMDTRQVIARFEAERQALALMDHPNIAKVLEGGETASGRPYFVMDLVKGVPITEYCDQNTLTTRERLELFVTVCQAVQHAHQKGIIHRDIKPSNVLVTLHDGAPLAKVIDFGVAKAMGQQLTEKTLFTGFAQMIGTPLYMSPEQAALSNVDVDTRSDIYSLGVLQYELLTGTTPFDKERLHQSGYDEIRRIIREEEPPKPSTRISTLGQAATTLSTQRKSDPRRLSQLFRGELDWIVMKALDKDRNRRYETASALAADVQRYLHDEPVQACPPSAGYRLRKFARRNKGPVLAGTTILLVLLGGIVGTTWGMLGAKAAARAEKQAKETAQQSAAEAKAVLDFLENKVVAAARPKDEAGGQGYDVKLADAVKAALPFVDKNFTGQPLVEARLRMTMGVSFEYLGDAKTAIEQFQAARQLYTAHRGPDHPDTLASMNNLANSYFSAGRTQEALKLREETLPLRKARQGPDHPDTLGSMVNLAVSYNGLGRLTDAVKLYEEALPVMKANMPDHQFTFNCMYNLAICYDAAGRTQDALKLREETLQLRKARLGPDHSDTLRSMLALAVSYDAAGRTQEALKLKKETLQLQKAKLGADHPDTLASMNSLAASYDAVGRTQEALKLFEETLQLCKAKFGPDHRYTLLGMYNLANSYFTAGRTQEALKLREETLQLQKAKLGADHPDTVASMDNLAVSYADAGRTQEALKLGEEMLQLRKAKLGLDHPDTLRTMTNLAGTYIDVGEAAKAVPILQDALASRARRVKAEPGNSVEQTYLAWTHGVMGAAEQARMDYAAAVQAYARSVEIFEKLDQDGALKTPLFRGRLSDYRQRLALCRKAKRAVTDLDFVLQQPAAEVPGLLDLRVRFLLKGQKLLAAVESAARMKERAGDKAEQLYDAACAYALCAEAAKQAKSPVAIAPGFEKLAEEALALLKQAVARGYKDAAHMKQDKDLVALGARADFKKLLTELEAAKKP
jgi:serine/threonine protein kinase